MLKFFVGHMLCPSLEPSRRDGFHEGSEHIFAENLTKLIFGLSFLVEYCRVVRIALIFIL